MLGGYGDGRRGFSQSGLGLALRGDVFGQRDAAAGPERFTINEDAMSL